MTINLKPKVIKYNFVSQKLIPLYKEGNSKGTSYSRQDTSIKSGLTPEEKTVLPIFIDAEVKQSEPFNTLPISQTVSGESVQIKLLLSETSYL